MRSPTPLIYAISIRSCVRRLRNRTGSTGSARKTARSQTPRSTTPPPQTPGEGPPSPRGLAVPRYGAKLPAQPDRALPDPDVKPPPYERPPPMPHGLGSTVELLKVLLRFEAERHAVAPRLIAAVADLERIAADDEAGVPALRGWRRDVFGERALAPKHGKNALTLNRGRGTP